MPNLHRFANPTAFLRVSQRLTPWLLLAASATLACGLYFALLASPPDYQQGESVRIMYVHVPSAWMSLGIYAALAANSAAYLIWRHPLADLAARESALPGAAFTALCLLTGMLWGKPMWGAWWVWDARLTSELVLLFLYIGYIALTNSVEPGERGRKACAILALIGVANLPIIHFSVEWWNTLHQPAGLLRAGGSAIHPAIRTPLLVMAAAYLLIFLAIISMRMQAALLEQKARRQALR